MSADYSVERTESIIKRWAPIALIVAAMVGLKLALLATDAVAFNSDEAVVGLMARHIRQGERPTFFYGQAYLGSLDAWLVAIAFSIFGQSVLSIRLVQIALFAGTLITTYQVAGRLGLDVWTSRLAALLMALPPTLLTLYTTATLGGYGETLLFGNILILIALSIGAPVGQHPYAGQAQFLRWGVQKVFPPQLDCGGSSATAAGTVTQHPNANRAQFMRWGMLGFIAGFAFWTFGLILIYLIPLSVWLLVRHRLAAWREYVVAAAGFVVGSAPWWLAIAQLGGSVVAELAGAAVAGTVAAPVWLDSLGVRLINFFVFGLSAWLGLRYPWSPELIIPVIGVAVLAMYGAAHVAAIRRGPGILWGMIGALLLTYLVTPFGGDPSGRYFVPLYLPLSIFTATLLARLRGVWNGRLVGLLVALIIGYNVAGSILAATQRPPGITTQFDRVTWIDHDRDQELMEFLLAHGERRGYTNYWVAHPIAFLSGEQIISTARLPYHLDLSYTRRDDRYPPYAQAVAESPRAFYVTTNHPPLDGLLREQLAALAVIFSEETIGNYHIFYNLSRKVTPEGLRLEKKRIPSPTRFVAPRVRCVQTWRKRRYEGAFISKLSDSESESAETQVWLEFAVKCKYMKREEAAALYKTYDSILGTLVGMINRPGTWVIRRR